ncbi:MAG: hypothetical protein K0Q79_3200 [Flavipsychrobacter sp.]|jgi:hypothetical protein|nr:hypothetical protein [Flavipsychrobacter sp.]
MSQVIDKKLHAAIDKLNAKQKKELLVVVGNILEESEEGYDKWEDESFVTEMEKRYTHYKNGGKMVTAKEANSRIKKLLAPKNK